VGPLNPAARLEIAEVQNVLAPKASPLWTVRETTPLVGMLRRVSKSVNKWRRPYNPSEFRRVEGLRCENWLA